MPMRMCMRMPPCMLKRTQAQSLMMPTHPPMLAAPQARKLQLTALLQAHHVRLRQGAHRRLTTVTLTEAAPR